VPDGLDAFEHFWANLEAERVDWKRQRKDIDAHRAHVSGLMSALRESGLLEQTAFAAPACAHSNAVPVESVVTGELLARLCPDCDEQLPAPRETLDYVDRVSGMRERLA
jgi:hypothetical protein